MTKDPKRKDRETVDPADDEQQEPTWRDPGSLARERQAEGEDQEGDDEQPRTQTDQSGQGF